MKNLTNEQILKKAIERAMRNGWDKEKAENWLSCIEAETYCVDEKGNRNFDENYYIFSHDFAKAFWGKEKYYFEYPDNDLWFAQADDPCEYGAYFKGRAWKYHLQQMVLEKEPLKYLEKFLE